MYIQKNSSIRFFTKLKIFFSRATQNDKNPSDESPNKNNPPSRRLSESELNELVKKIEKFPGFVKNKLSAKIAYQSGYPFITFYDGNGHAIRRVSAFEVMQMTWRASDIKGIFINKKL